MSTFTKILKKHQAEIERMIEEQEHGTSLSYPLMREMGMLSPFAVRLPIPLIAALDEMTKHGLWRSKQEMVYEMIQSAFADFLESSSEKTRGEFGAIQKKALENWEKSRKKKKNRKGEQK